MHSVSSLWVSLGCSHDNKRATCRSHAHWCHITFRSHMSTWRSIYQSQTLPRIVKKKGETLDVLSMTFHTCVRAGYEGELALILMSVQALQGADHLTALRCIHTTYLQTG